MCAKATAAAASFSISGLLDSQSKTRERYPVVEIEVDAIQDHPNNAIYSMDETEIERLAESIKRDGLTDLPLVRKLPDGQWQMLSGHRRKAAFTMLSIDNNRYGKMPCRVVDSISDAQALTLLHTVNLFTRQLSVTERAAASRALGVEVEQLRESNPELRGQRTEDIKASIISQQTGRKVSGKTIKRQEDMAERAAALGPGWQKIADRELLSADALRALETMDSSEADELCKAASATDITKREVTTLITSAANQVTDEPNPHLVRSERALAAYVSGQNCPPNERERELLASLRLSLLKLEGGE
ncbi:MAG: ParB/RepB/Spo0J family partition protein [Raoultibacter sp.]|jgi:ParB family chromosome partitioning protein